MNYDLRGHWRPHKVTFLFKNPFILKSVLIEMLSHQKNTWVLIISNTYKLFQNKIWPQKSLIFYKSSCIRERLAYSYNPISSVWKAWYWNDMKAIYTYLAGFMGDNPHE